MEIMKKYGRPHRMFVQAMLTRGIIASSELTDLFGLVCKRCEIELPADTKELSKAFYFAVNSKIVEKCNLKLVKVFDESKKGKSSFLLLVNKTDRSKDDNKLTIKDQATFPPHEMEYLKLIVDDIMENPLREVKETRALSISNHVNRNNKKIPAQEAEVILQKFKDHKWLADYEIEQKNREGKSYNPQRWIKTGIILLSTRFIYEMEPFLKEVYPKLVGSCSAPKCKKIVIRGINCPNEDCECQYHIYCLNDMKRKSRNDEGQIEVSKPMCIKCDSELPEKFQTHENNRPRLAPLSVKRKRVREESSSDSE